MFTALYGQEVFLLGGHQFRGVQQCYRTVFADKSPHGIDVKLIDPAGDPGSDFCLSRLIELHHANSGYFPGERLLSSFYGGNVGHDPLRVGECYLSKALCLLLLFRCLVSRTALQLFYQLHIADRAGARFVLNDKGVHGAGVLDLALSCLAFGSMIVTGMLPRIPAATGKGDEEKGDQGEDDFLVQCHGNLFNCSINSMKNG